MCVQVQSEAFSRELAPVNGQPPVWTLPYPRNPYFTGREDHLRALESALAQTNEDTEPRPHAIHGLGGVGKTGLVIEYAFRNRDRYDVAVWAAADSPEALRANLAALAGPSALNLPQHAEADEALLLDAVLQWLHRHGRWLLILDGADMAAATDAVLELLPRLAAGHLLITTRHSDWPIPVRGLSVDTFTKAEAAQFLLDRTRDTQPSPGTREEALAIAHELGSLPLALEQAAAYTTRRRIRFADYLAKYSIASAEVLAHLAPGATDYKSTALATWRVTEAELGCEARTVLRIVGFLAPAEIPRGLLARSPSAFQSALAHLEEELGTPRGEAQRDTKTDPVESLEHALVELADYSMIALRPDGFSCHPLVMAAQTADLSAEEQKFWRGAALQTLEAAAPPQPGDVQTWNVWNSLLPHAIKVVGGADHDGAVARTSLDLGDTRFWLQVDVANLTASLMGGLGNLLAAKARWAEAEPFLRRALALNEDALDEAPTAVATSMSNLASLLASTNRLKEAEPLMRRALELDEENLSEDDPALAVDLSHLADLLRQTSRLDEAEPLYRRALDITVSTLGPEDPTVAIRLDNLAGLLRSTKRSSEAELLYRRALAIGEKALGPEHPTVVFCAANLAMLLLESSQVAEAERLSHRALTFSEKTFGPEHPNTASALKNLAAVLHTGGRLTEAERLLRSALAIDEKCFGSAHPEVATCLNNLATVVRADGRLAEAEPLSRLALVLLLQSTIQMGHEHAHLDAASGVYQAILCDLGLTEAEVAERLQAALEAANQNAIAAVGPDGAPRVGI